MPHIVCMSHQEHTDKDGSYLSGSYDEWDDMLLELLDDSVDKQLSQDGKKREKEKFSCIT